MSSWEFDESWLYWIAGAGFLVFLWGAFLWHRARPHMPESSGSLIAPEPIAGDRVRADSSMAAAEPPQPPLTGRPAGETAVPEMPPPGAAPPPPPA